MLNSKEKKSNLEMFIKLIIGHFNNKEQFEEMQKSGRVYPYAEHVNTICNDKIKNLDRFFSLGVLQYCDDNSIKIFDISDIEDEKIENIIRRVRNKKLVSKNKGLLGG